MPHEKPAEFYDNNDFQLKYISPSDSISSNPDLVLGTRWWVVMVTVVIERWMDEREWPVVCEFSSSFDVLTAPACDK